MKRITLLLVFAIALLCSSVDAQEASFSTPEITEKHKNVFHEMGEWNGEMTMYMGPEPTVIKCHEHNHRLGTWMISNFTYELDGKKMRGHGQFAYDSGTEKYAGTWIDNSKESLSIMDGKWDESTKAMTWMMKDKDPEGNEVNLKTVSTLTSETTKEFTMSMQAPGSQEWTKVMEVKFKKVEKPSTK